ncbi:MAG TPA: GGDEF domain-containing protein [Polyangia bacterium]
MRRALRLPTTAGLVLAGALLAATAAAAPPGPAARAASPRRSPPPSIGVAAAKTEPSLFSRRDGWWVGVVIAAGLVAYALHHWRLRGQLRRVAELEQLVAERTRQVRDLSLRDPVTGLRNRRFVVELMARGGPPRPSPAADHRRLAIPGTLGLFVIEVDGLGALNDRFGRDSGDLVLKQVAAVVQQSVRREDTVARWDGAALLVLARYAEPEALVFLAERLRKQVAATEASVGAAQAVHPTCAIGYAAFPLNDKLGDDVLGWETVAALAAHARRRAQAAGGDHTVFVQPGRALPVPAELPALLADPAGAEERGVVVLADTTGWKVRAPDEARPGRSA